MRLIYINVGNCETAIEKTTDNNDREGDMTCSYSQDVVGVHPELCADVGGLVPPLARLLVHHLSHHLHTVRGVRSGVIFPVPSAV